MTQVAAHNGPERAQGRNILASAIDAFRYHGYRDFVRNFDRIGSQQVNLVELNLTPKVVENPTVGYSSFAFYKPCNAVAHGVEDGKPPVPQLLPADMVIRPTGMSVVSNVLRPTAQIILALPTEAVRRYMGDDDADIETLFAPLDARPFRSDLMTAIIERLSANAFSDGVNEPRYSDTLLQALTHELVRLCQRRSREIHSINQPMSDDMLRKIDAYLDEQTVKKLDLAELGRLVGLSSSQFSKAFKSAVGMTPYQYILNRRVARAQKLIETSRYSLSEIAFRCGFSSQSHMTDVFRTRLGATPAAYRSDLN